MLNPALKGQKVTNYALFNPFNPIINGEKHLENRKQQKLTQNYGKIPLYNI
jgi:hypothetical protein